MNVKASSTLKSLQEKKPQTWGWGHRFMLHRGRHGVGGGLAALGSVISSLVCIKGLVLMQLCVCGSAVWHCMKTHQSGGAAAEFKGWMSGIGRRGAMESWWYFQATNEMWRRIKLLCFSHARQYHWSTELLPPAPQPSIWHGSCLLLPLAFSYFRSPLSSSFFHF